MKTENIIIAAVAATVAVAATAAINIIIAGRLRSNIQQDRISLLESTSDALLNAGANAAEDIIADALNEAKAEAEKDKEAEKADSMSASSNDNPELPAQA